MRMMVILGFYGVGEFWKNFQNVHAPPGGTKFVARRHTRSVTLSSWTCSDMGSQCERVTLSMRMSMIARHERCEFQEQGMELMVIPPGDTCKTVASKAFGAWQHEAPAKRSGSVYRLTALEQRQAIMQRQDL
ncbi:hypothetical protein DEO72_LG1g2996 [Vigna unguiculata]|uniref:Uncharacterized protein n=1 Tax=Vigna unguiculata TaxID=3917 RepID=A0A4D6KU40_VIGUN|nr:hypothetical protein DEO72_LG1g2996 [Vigna unguiculata]